MCFVGCECSWEMESMMDSVADGMLDDELGEPNTPRQLQYQISNK